MVLEEIPKNTNLYNKEKNEIINNFQTIFSDFKNEILDNPLTKEDIIALFNTNGAYGKALRDNQNKAYFKEGNNTKVNLERVYNYIIRTCASKDPSFTKIIKNYEKTIPISSQFTWQNLYYRKIMILNTYFVEKYWLFFSFATDHMALTPDPIVSAEKRQVPKDWQEKIQTIIKNMWFEVKNTSIDFIFVDWKVPNSNIQAMYIIKNIFAFETSNSISDEDLYARIANEYLHKSFEDKYWEKILLRDKIKREWKDYFIWLTLDWIFTDMSRYSVTGHSVQEFLSDVAEMQLWGGKNQLDLRHKAYNLKERGFCREQYRNSTRLITHLINDEPKLTTIYKEYKKVLQNSGNKTADVFLLKNLQETKITKNWKEISCQEYISLAYKEKAKYLVKVLDDFVKTKK